MDLSDAPLWLQAVATIAVALITTFLLPYLKQLATAQKAKAAQAEVEYAESEISAKEYFLDLVKDFLLERAESIAEKNFPALAAKVISGEVKDADSIKAELRSWGSGLKAEAIEFCQKQGLDLIGMIGDDYLDKLIESAANAVSPLKGAETAKVLLQEKISNQLIEYGVAYVKKHWLGSIEEE